MAALVDDLQENICSQHNKQKDIFCRTDQQLLCLICSVDQHKDHDMVSSATERAQRQAQLPARRTLLLQSLQNKEKVLKRLTLEAQEISRFGRRAVRCSEYCFKAMALALEKRRCEVEQQIQSEQETQLRRVQELQNQLQKDMAELRRNITELDTLSHTPDHNQFILRCPLQSTDSQSTVSTVSQSTETRIQIRPRKYFEDVSTAMSEFSQKLRLTLTEFKVPEPEPRSREGFLRYAQDLTLDPNTAHLQLYLSEGNKRVTFISVPQWYPDHPDRFGVYQVLSREELTGRCYWELEWGTETGIVVAVSYSDIQRKDGDSGFGRNDQSWALDCDKSGYSFRFNSVQSEVSGPVGSRVGVYLDHRAGALSFYSVQDQTMTLLHRVQTQFTKPLCAGVGLGCFGTVHFPQLQ